MHCNRRGLEQKYPILGYPGIEFYPSWMSAEKIYRQKYQEMLLRLKLERERAGFTQQQVADTIGKPQSYVSKCEAGERRIDVIELLEFVQLYKVDLRDIVEGKND